MFFFILSMGFFYSICFFVLIFVTCHFTCAIEMKLHSGGFMKKMQMQLQNRLSLWKLWQKRWGDIQTYSILRGNSLCDVAHSNRTYDVKNYKVCLVCVNKAQSKTFHKFIGLLGLVGQNLAFQLRYSYSIPTSVIN